jgi:hypothetical protein
MPAVMTGIRDAQGRTVATLPIAVRQALMVADDLLRLHDMQFELLCEACSRRHPDEPNRWTVTARHAGDDGALAELVCNCTRRKFVAAF